MKLVDNEKRDAIIAVAYAGVNRQAEIKLQ